MNRCNQIEFYTNSKNYIVRISEGNLIGHTTTTICIELQSSRENEMTTSKCENTLRHLNFNNQIRIILYKWYKWAKPSKIFCFAILRNLNLAHTQKHLRSTGVEEVMCIVRVIRKENVALITMCEMTTFVWMPDLCFQSQSSSKKIFT